MTEDNHGENGIAGPGRSVEIREALWVAAMACMGLLLLVLLHQSSDVMGEYAQSGELKIPASFWLSAVSFLVVNFSVFPLLKNSKPVGFKVLAYILTGIVPTVVLLFVVLNLLMSGN